MTVFVSEDTIDDLLRGVSQRVVQDGVRITPTKGDALDLNAAVLELRDPRARLGRSVTRGRLVSPVGELCWYLSGRDDIHQIVYYIKDYERLAEEGKAWGGYGPRLFKGERSGPIHDAINRLRSNPDSRNAVVQIFDQQDLDGNHKDIPCTCLFQFLIRGNQLHQITYMRSNDVRRGLPHDVFAFTMLQELVASSLGLPMGPYVHVVGSLHVYEQDVAEVKTFLEEGWQSTNPMPSMPLSDPWGNVADLLAAEEQLRAGEEPTSVELPVDPYWSDLARVLVVFALVRKRRYEEAEAAARRFHDPVYELLAVERAQREE